jgi:uncharacterized protein YcfL
MKMKLITVVSLTFLLFSGCVTPQAKHESNIAQVVDKCITDTIVIEDIKGKKQRDGFMKTQITGRNTSNSYQQLEYKIVWLDNDGFVIKSILSNWRKVSADKNQDFYITNISPNTKANDFRLYIRQNNKEILCNQ